MKVHVVNQMGKSISIDTDSLSTDAMESLIYQLKSRLDDKYTEKESHYIDNDTDLELFN